MFGNELERKINNNSKGGSLGKLGVFLILSAQLQKNRTEKE